MAQSQRKIVLMACGSFSPPTPMHLRMFEIARDYIHSMGLGNVIGGIVSPVHDAYGKKELVSSTHRCAMLKLALRSSDWIKVSDWEVNQKGWTRTRASLKYHQDTLNNYIYCTNDTGDPPKWIPDDILNLNSNNQMDMPHDMSSCDNFQVNGDCMRLSDRSVQLKLLCGADLLESFSVPGLWSNSDLESILGDHGLVVITRSGANADRFIHESDILTRFMSNITLITNWIPNEVSSTVIRRLLRRGESVKYLIDDSIISYCRQNQLYGCPDDKIHIEYMSDKKNAGRDEINYKNILISIRDKPTILDETITVKKAKKSSFSIIPKSRDSVCPMTSVCPKLGYTNRSPVKLPGKPVKIVTKVFDSDEVSLNEPQTDRNDNILNTNTLKISNDVTYDLCHYRADLNDGIRRSKSQHTKLTEEGSLFSFKTRSCNDLIRLVLTRKGIEIISDSEAIV